MSRTEVKLSVAIITLNEERNIGRCLASLADLADEVVVVDSGSSDQTVEICASHGARVVHQDFLGHIEQKNLAWSLTTGDFVLSLDADEALSPELRNSLRNWKSSVRPSSGERSSAPSSSERSSAPVPVPARSAAPANPVTAWSMNRLTNYRGHWVRHGGWYPDRKVRLARRDAAAWTGENPHDRLEPTGEVAWLAGDLLHYSYNDLSDHLRQIRFFTDIAATASGRQRPSPIFEVWARQGFQFVKNVVLRGGFRDGRAGWQIGWWSAFATGEKYRKISRIVRGRRLLAAAGRAEVRRVWICRTDGIGDGVVTLPIAGWLRAYAGDGLEIGWVCRPYAAAVGERCSDVDRVILWQPGEDLSAEGVVPDLAILAFPDRELLERLIALGVPVLAGSSRRLHTWRSLTHGVWQSRKRSGRHEAWHGLQLLEPVRLLPGLAKPGKALPRPDDDFSKWIHFERPEVPEGWPEGCAVVHPGSHGSANNISVAKYGQVIEALCGMGWQVCVTGTAKERESLESLPWANAQVEDWTGRLTVDALMGGLAHAGLCVAASTGPLHLASALGTPVVGLFGGEAPVWPERWRPLGPRVKVVVAEGVEEGSGLALSTAEIIEAIEQLTAKDAARGDR